MIANLPAPLRHLIVLVAPGLLAWAASDVIPWLKGQPGYGLILAGIGSALLAVLTPLVQSYGRGKREVR